MDTKRLLKQLFFIVLFTILLPTRLWAQEPYAVLSDENTVLTFYYDNQKESRGGMSVGPFSYPNDRGWDSVRNSIKLVAFDSSFANCTTLTSTYCWFVNCENLKTVDGIVNLKTNNVIDMGSMFENCFNLSALDLRYLDTKNVTSMQYMFYDCYSLTSLDLSGFDTSKVKYMRKMFHGCSSLTNLELSSFKTTNVQDMYQMFYDCSSLESLNLESFNTSKISDMSDLFMGCSHLKSLNLSNFDTSNVGDMSSMFWRCSSLEELNLNGFNTLNVKKMSYMFYQCSALKNLDVSSFNTSNVIDMSSMFEKCSSLKSLDVSAFNTSNVIFMSSMFSDCEVLTDLNLSNFDTSNVTTVSSMFFNCYALLNLDLSSFDTSKVTDMSDMFLSCKKLKEFNLGNFNTSKVKNMSGMFCICHSLTTLDLSSFNTSNVTNMTEMFNNCPNLKSVFVSDLWSTSSVTKSYDMFVGCERLKGEQGTTYNPDNTDISYAHIDGGQSNPGYFTYKENKGGCEFSDLPNTNDFYAATCYLYSLGVLSGTDNDGKMEVDNPLKRAHLAKIGFRGVYSINGRTIPATVPSDNYPTVYTDLTDKSTYYYQAARALLYLEYCDGVAPFDRNRLAFDPEDKITRVNVLKVLLETFNIKSDLEGTDNPFPNDENVAALAQSDPLKMGYIRKAATLGIITTANAEFRPYDDCKRGEAFLMLARIMQKIEAGEIADPNPQESDYFEPLNTTLKTISLGASLQMGNFQHYTKTSFAINGVVPLAFAHTYNSYNTTLPSVFFGDKSKTDVDDSYLPLGDGWSHNYHSFITVVGDYQSNSADNGLRVIVHWGGGSIDVYKSDGTKLVPESMGVYDEMEYAGGDELTIKSKSQIEYLFSKQGGSGAAVFYLSSVKDRNGNTLTINYEDGLNGSKRIKSVSDGNRSLDFSYLSDTDLLSEVKDPLSRSIMFNYFDNKQTGKKQLKSFTDAEGNTTTYDYADLSKVGTSKLLSRIQLPKGNYIENEYDANSRLKNSESGVSGVPTTKTSVNVQTNYGSGSVSTKSQVEVERGSQTSSYNFTYNENNVVTGMTGAKDMFVNGTYGNADHPELPTAMQSNSIDVSNVNYDEKGNVTSISVSGDGTLTTTMTYDEMNNLTSRTDPMGNKTTFSYDGNGNLTEVSAPEGVTASITVNSKGLPTETSNAMGVKTQYEYNEYGNLIKTTLPALGLSSTAVYDAASRLTSITDALGRTNSFVYNNNDYLTSETDAMNHTTKYSYDANDNLTSITNAKGGVTTMSYDNATDWLLSVEFAGAKKQYDYNKDGTLSTFTKPDGTTLSYSYDELGRITSDGANSYSYDNKLRLSEISDGSKSVSFSYDGFNRISGTECDGTHNSYSYDKNGNCTSVNDTQYSYDGLNRLTSVSFSGGTINYIYRKDSKLEKVEYPNGMTTTFDYDGVGRLTGKQTTLANGKVVAGYNYVLDKVGNIIEQTMSEPYEEPYEETVLSDNEVSYSYDDGNRITKAGDISFEFDANGNTTKRGGESYVWDKQDRMTVVGTIPITYDPLGLIASYEDITFTTDLLGIGNVLSDSKSGAEYIYGNGLEARVINGKASYYVTDIRGSVVAIVDENGNITHKYQYDDFGKVVQKSEADYNPFQYVGKYGVIYLSDHHYYMRARHYDPTIGRFLSEDPIWSTNLYPYADNNPIMGIDPRGTDSKILHEISTDKLVLKYQLLSKKYEDLGDQMFYHKLHDDYYKHMENNRLAYQNQLKEVMDEIYSRKDYKQYEEILSYYEHLWYDKPEDRIDNAYAPVSIETSSSTEKVYNKQFRQNSNNYGHREDIEWDKVSGYGDNTSKVNNNPANVIIDAAISCGKNHKACIGL